MPCLELTWQPVLCREQGKGLNWNKVVGCISPCGLRCDFHDDDDEADHHKGAASMLRGTRKAAKENEQQPDTWVLSHVILARCIRWWDPASGQWRCMCRAPPLPWEFCI